MSNDLRKSLFDSFRRLKIILVVFSLVHTPLPQPDFHNIRHHDGPGELCEHHDHLLRWHPSAGDAEDVETLHWHWFYPGEQGKVPATDPSHAAIHAHVADGFAVSWDDGPRLSPDNSFQHLVRITSLVSTLLPIDLIHTSTLDGGDRQRFLSGQGASLARRPSPTALLERWLC